MHDDRCKVNDTVSFRKGHLFGLMLRALNSSMGGSPLQPLSADDDDDDDTIVYAIVGGLLQWAARITYSGPVPLENMKKGDDMWLECAWEGVGRANEYITRLNMVNYYELATSLLFIYLSYHTSTVS